MTEKLLVPDIGDFQNVEVIEILKNVGEKIKKNDPIVTIESDKSSVEVPSIFEGTVKSINVKIGDKVSKGSVLATIEIEESKNFTTPTETKKQTDEKIKPLLLKDQTLERSEKKDDGILPETEKIIKAAESTIPQKIKKGLTKKVPARSNGADIDPVETKNG